MLRKVLIVDDSRMVHQMYKIILMRYEDCELLGATDGREGLDLLSEHGDIDLVLLDMRMPGMSGCEFLAEMKGSPKGRGIPVVIISSKDRDECGIEELSQHVSGFLNKRYASEGIHEIIGELFPRVA